MQLSYIRINFIGLQIFILFSKMEIKNPQFEEAKTKLKPRPRKSLLQSSIQAIEQNQLNLSKSKMQYSFPKSQRFNHSISSISPDKLYDLPPVLKTQRSSSFGFGQKTDFSKNGASIPAPGNYQIKRQFQGDMKQGSYMGLSRQKIKFNDLFKMQTSNKFPEPASYSINFKHSGHKISIGQKFSEKKKWIDLVPGPGNYDHQQPTTKLKSTVSNFRSSPTAKFPKTERLKQLKSTDKLTPGPGNYKIDFGWIKKDSTKFGKSLRDQKPIGAKVLSPGPGKYSLFSQFLH